jgi:hypothetical protein
VSPHRLQWWSTGKKFQWELSVLHICADELLLQGKRRMDDIPVRCPGHESDRLIPYLWVYIQAAISLDNRKIKWGSRRAVKMVNLCMEQERIDL